MEKISLPCVYEKIEYVPDKQIVIYAKDNRIGIMNHGKMKFFGRRHTVPIFMSLKKKTQKRQKICLLYTKNGQYGLVDMLEGKLVLECEYDDISKDSRKKGILDFE